MVNNIKNSIELPQKLRVLVSEIVSGSKLEVREAQKKLKDIFLHQSRNKNGSEMMPLLIDLFIDSFAGAEILNQAALLTCLNYACWYTLPEQHSPLADLAFTALGSQSGTVRHSAVRFLETFCSATLALSDLSYIGIRSTAKTRSTDQKLLISMYETVLEKIAYTRPLLSRPEQEKEYVDDLQPSPYKSYQLAAQAIAFRNRYTEAIIREARYDPDEELLCYRPYDETFDDDPRYQETDTLPPKPPKQAASYPTLAKLDQFARHNLIHETELIGYPIREREVASICESLLDPSFTQEQLFVMTMQKVITGRYVEEIHDLNGFVRSFQFLVDCLVQTGNEDRTLYSNDLLLIIGRERTYQRRQKPDDYEAFTQLYVDIQSELPRFAKEFLISDSHISIIRHVIHWYAQVEPWIFFKRTVPQLIAIGWYVFNRFNTIVNTNYDSDIYPRDVADWSGWTGTVSSFSSSCQGPFYDVIYAVQDPDLLSVNPQTNYINWVTRLQKVAPAFEYD